MTKQMTGKKQNEMQAEENKETVKLITSEQLLHLSLDAIFEKLDEILNIAKNGTA